MDETAQRVRHVIDVAADTHREFAARIGLEPTKLSKSLKGNRRFTADELSAVAAAGGVSVDWLMHGQGPGPAEQQPDPASDTERTGDERRRAEFLEAAWKLISEHGYHAVRISDIARTCGTSSGAVHYYFPTKQDLLSAALRHCVECAFERQSSRLRSVDGAHARLLALIDMQLPLPGRVRDEWLVWLQFWAETALRPELRAIHNDFYARWREAVVRIVRRGQREGQFRADADAEQLALGLTALTDGLAIQVLTGAPGATPERMRGVLLDFIERELLVTDGGFHDRADV
ncbi:TetR family transcriptional regulator C-terminal domain-containing protein [Streptomyces sp. NPDC058067]|uniref:TetR family transcriptional regulator C-terminal domain-containing protein n=1 Tax=Streptomyces sp. NPDC058067 TaxID=3346324 RepID=UPI0036EA1452